MELFNAVSCVELSLTSSQDSPFYVQHGHSPRLRCWTCNVSGSSLSFPKVLCEWQSNVSRKFCVSSASGKDIRRIASDRALISLHADHTRGVNLLARACMGVAAFARTRQILS